MVDLVTYAQRGRALVTPFTEAMRVRAIGTVIIAAEARLAIPTERLDGKTSVGRVIDGADTILMVAQTRRLSLPLYERIWGLQALFRKTVKRVGT